MANYTVKLGHQEDIILRMSKQQQSNLAEDYFMLFRVHHIVQQHPDHPDHRLTINMSETLLHVPNHFLTNLWYSQKFMSRLINKWLQLHKDSLGRFLSLSGDGVHLVLSDLLDNKPTPTASEEVFIHLFEFYIHSYVNRVYQKLGHSIKPVVVDCEIVRYHQFIDLNEAVAWWESTPISVNDMVPATNSSPSIYILHKLGRLYDKRKVMNTYMVFFGQPQQCPICLEDYFPSPTEVAELCCLHQFHVHCITQWFKKSYTCPVCRLVFD